MERGRAHAEQRTTMSKRHQVLHPTDSGKEDTPNQHHGPSGHRSGCALGVSAAPSGLEADGVAGDVLPASESLPLRQRVCKCFMPMG